MSDKKERNILITSALPYANGPIHIGHLVEYVQTDIWVRYHRFMNRNAFYFCADDTHGTPVMIAARKAGITPEELTQKVHAEHYRDLASFHVSFDNYYTTNSSENRELAEFIYLAAKKKGHINRKTLNQLYCSHDQMFLPDRFVKGTCPSCGAKDQYGDSCEVCGATYNPEDLSDAACSICGNSPVIRETEHLFFKLGDFQKFLETWLNTPGRVDDGIRKKMDEWLTGGLRDWDISRDGPYFGFEIPEEENKYFYVWLDAPIGYMASARNYFNKIRKPELFDSFWKAESSSEVYHFIGKDIVYFHTLFWPALLHCAGFRTPTAVHVHGFLTVEGEKMSKSRGTLVRAETYLKHLPPEALRYYYAGRLTGGLDDLDFSVNEFVNRYNTDVVGNITNIFSRLGTSIADKLGRKLSERLTEEGEALLKKAEETAKNTAELYENRSYARVLREITALADEINRYVASKEPWKQIKEDPEAARNTLTDALTAAKAVTGLISPILPVFAEQAAALLNLQEPITFKNLTDRFGPGHTLAAYKPLAVRIDPKNVENMMEEEKKSAAAQNPEIPKKTETREAPGTGLISIDDLSKVELKTGKILTAELVEGADKLLRITLDLGEEKPRNVIAGIRAAYQPEDLIGLHVVAVANLQPRKMKFGISEAMLLAAGEGSTLSLFTPHRGAKPGDRLK